MYNRIATQKWLRSLLNLVYQKRETSLFASYFHIFISTFLVTYSLLFHSLKACEPPREYWHSFSTIRRLSKPRTTSLNLMSQLKHECRAVSSSSEIDIPWFRTYSYIFFLSRLRRTDCRRPQFVPLIRRGWSEKDGRSRRMRKVLEVSRRRHDESHWGPLHRCFQKRFVCLRSALR